MPRCTGPLNIRLRPDRRDQTAAHRPGRDPISRRVPPRGAVAAQPTTVHVAVYDTGEDMATARPVPTSWDGVRGTAVRSGTAAGGARCCRNGRWRSSTGVLRGGTTASGRHRAPRLNGHVMVTATGDIKGHGLRIAPGDERRPVNDDTDRSKVIGPPASTCRPRGQPRREVDSSAETCTRTGDCGDELADPGRPPFTETRRSPSPTRHGAGRTRCRQSRVDPESPRGRTRSC